MIAAERRRRITQWAAHHGSVSVSSLAKMLNVTENTVRSDLVRLDREGILVRSYGGAVIRTQSDPCPPYRQIKDTHTQEKAWIGAAAVRYVPTSGSMYIGAGSTTYQLAIRIPEGRHIDVVVNSPLIASYLVSNFIGSVHILGGKINPDSQASDCSWSADILGMLHWDVCFVGVEGIDTDRGITAATVAGALSEVKILEHSKKVVVLCDSSKFGRISHARVGAVSLIDVLITDPGISPGIVKDLTDRGVEVVVAGPNDAEPIPTIEPLEAGDRI